MRSAQDPTYRECHDRRAGSPRHESCAHAGPAVIDVNPDGRTSLVRVGDQLPSFHLVDHEGRSWRTDEQLGRPLVLVLHRHLA